MKKFLIGCCFTAIHYVLFSQGTISGRVTEKETKEGLPGATVALKGTSISVITDNDGNFLLQKIKPGKYTVKISYVGYITIDIDVEITENITLPVSVPLETDPRVGNTVVVTASNRPQKITDAPASISVFGVKDFEQFAGSNINELVSRVNGIQIQRSGIDWIAINARNFNSGGNLKVLPYVDGRLNRAALSANVPIFNMGSYSKEDLERVEIVFGPQTALYGPNALNAVFNVITKDPRKYQGTTVALSGGNHYQFSGRFRHAERINNKLAYKLSGEYAAGRDYDFSDSVYVTKYPPYDSCVREHNVNLNFRHLRAEGYVYYSLTPRADIVVSAGVGKGNFLQPGRIQGIDVIHGFVQARLVHQNYFIGVSNTFGDIGKLRQIHPYTRTFWNLTHQPNPLPPEVAEDSALKLSTGKEKSRRINIDAQYKYSFKKAGLFLIGGLNYQLEKPRGFGVNLLDSFQHIRITQYGAVVQAEKSLPWNMRFIGALRYDHHSNYGGFFSPKLALIKSFGENSLRITWGKAYATPNIFSQYTNIGKVNFGNAEGIIYIPNGTRMNGEVPENPEDYKVTAPTKAEEISSWEFGYKGAMLKNLFVDITSYYNVSKNYLGGQTIGGRAEYAAGQKLYPLNRGRVVNGVLNGASFSCTGNYGLVHHYGLDVSLNYSLNKFINLAIQYSWFGSSITDSVQNNDANRDKYITKEERSLNAPEHKGMIGLNIQNFFKNKMFVNIWTRLVQQYDAYGGAQIGTEAGKGSRGRVLGPNGYINKNFDWGPLGGFISFDINAGYRINKMLNLNMNITNLFNTRQMEALGSPSIGRLIMFELKVHVPNKKD